MDRDLAWVMTDLMGVASRQELLQCGVTRGRIQAGVVRGDLIRLESGLYRDSRSVDSLAFRRRRALAWARRDALLSHGSAAAVWGIADDEPFDDIHVTVPHGRRIPDLSGVTYHQARYWEGFGSAGWPVVGPRQTVIDLADDGDLDSQRFAALAAVQKGLLTVERLTDADLVPRRALARWAVVGQEAQAGAQSGAEALYWRAVTTAGLPHPQLNHPLRAGDNDYRVDAYWPEYLLGAEIDGRRHHERDPDFERDRVRQNNLHVAGVLILRFTVRQVIACPDEVVAVTRRALATRAAQLNLG